MKALAVDDRVELRTLPRRGERGTVVELTSSGSFVRILLDGETKPRLEPSWWLRRLSLLEVIAEAAAD